MMAWHECCEREWNGKGRRRKEVVGVLNGEKEWLWRLSGCRTVNLAYALSYTTLCVMSHHASFFVFSQSNFVGFRQ